MGRVDRTWVINGADNGNMNFFAEKPRIKSLTVSYEGEEPKVYPLPEETRASGATAYLRLIQMLTAYVGKTWMEKELLRRKYAITKEEFEKQKEKDSNQLRCYQPLSKSPFSDLSEIYVYKNWSVEDMDMANKFKELVTSLEETWRAAGNEVPKLTVQYTVGEGPAAGEEPAADGETAVDEEPQDTCPFELNTILFGPPGTGKTYLSRTYAVAIADGLSLNEVEKRYPKYAGVCARYEELKTADRVRMVTFHQAYGYEEFIQGIRPVMQDETQPGNQQGLAYKIRDGAFKEFCENAANDLENRYVFLIDEINRGNIAKIFGELITLIEPSKRDGAEEALSIRLPYDGEPFSVPNNVYLLGTMNTADRSLALLDTALRRRFDFVEMMPAPGLLSGVAVGEIDVETLLKNLNDRLELLIDREHTIGHAFFLPLKKAPTMKTLARIMKQKVIPLLQEFFYDDYGLLREVLGKKIVKERTDLAALKSRLEGRTNRELGGSYVIDYQALESPAAYKELLGRETDRTQTDQAQANGETDTHE